MARYHQVVPVRVGARTVTHPAEAQLREAFLAMTRALPKRPHWAFHEVASRTDRAPVYHATLRAIDSAIDAGAPVEDALAWTRELETYIRGRYITSEIRPISVLLLEEARADAEADVAQSEALAAPTPSAIARVIETGERHMERIREAIHHARLQLLSDRTKKPRLALARAGRGEVRHVEVSPSTGV